VGAIIRSALFFGIDGIVLSERHTAARLGGTVARASAGASEAMDNVFLAQGSLWTLLASSRRLGWRVVGTRVGDAQAGDAAPETRGQGRVLVLGSEGAGLPRNAVCDEYVCIPQRGGAETLDSLNVSVAAGILLASFTGSQIKTRIS
jgi:tRNA G18 (ribose-2'-O)-methylase SpoU